MLVISDFAAAQPIETYRGHILTLQDALLVLEATRLNLLPQVKRRFNDVERKLISPGSVYAWNEMQCGMKRWTDGKNWLASKVKGPFLTYQEYDESRNLKIHGLVKQSFSLTTKQNEKLHLIAYYDPQDRARGIGGNVPSQDEFFAKLRFDPSVYLHEILPLAAESQAMVRFPRDRPMDMIERPIGRLDMIDRTDRPQERPMERMDRNVDGSISRIERAIDRPMDAPIERIDRMPERMDDRAYVMPYYYPQMVPLQYMAYPGQQMYMPVPYDCRQDRFPDRFHDRFSAGSLDAYQYERPTPQRALLDRYERPPSAHNQLPVMSIPGLQNNVPNGQPVVTVQTQQNILRAQNVQNVQNAQNVQNTLISEDLTERRSSSGLGPVTLPGFTYTRKDILPQLPTPGWEPRQGLPGVEREDKDGKLRLPSTHELLLAVVGGHERAF